MQSTGMDGVSNPPAPVEFSRFTVVRHRRELFADGRLIELGGRAVWLEEEALLQFL